MVSDSNPGPIAPRPIGAGDPQALTPAPPAAAGTAARTLLRRALEIGISLVCVYLALRGIHLPDLWAALRGADYLWLVAFVLLLAFVLLVKAWRWQLLFYPEYRLPFGPLLAIMCVGYLLNNVLPGRLGELARVFLLAGEQPVSAARTLSTIIVERLLDVFSILVMLVCLLPFVQMPADMAHGAQALGVLAVAGAVALVLISLWKERIMRWVRSLLSHVRFLDRPQLYAALEHLLDGFAMLRSWFGLAVVGLALLSWVGVLGMAWTAAQAFHLPVPLTGVGMAVVATSLSMLIPASPGSIGTFHLAVKLVLVPLGVAPELAVSYALVWHGVNYLALTASGLIAMWVHGVSFRQVMTWRKKG